MILSTSDSGKIESRILALMALIPVGGKSTIVVGSHTHYSTAKTEGYRTSDLEIRTIKDESC